MSLIDRDLQTNMCATLGDIVAARADPGAALKGLLLVNERLNHALLLLWAKPILSVAVLPLISIAVAATLIADISVRGGNDGLAHRPAPSSGSGNITPGKNHLGESLPPSSVNAQPNRRVLERERSTA